MSRCGTTFRDYAVSISAIIDGLAGQVDSLVEHLLPNAKKDGHEWFVGSLAGEPGRSMAINRGSRAGVWKDFASGETGDALDLVAQVLFRGDKTEAIKWAKSWLGLDDADPARLKQYRIQAEARARTRKEEERQTEEKMRDAAGRIWRGSEHRIAGTPVEAYLMGRAIDLRAIGKAPGVLAFSRECWNKETNEKMPAMIAEVRKGRDFVGIHRTFLHVGRDGSAHKARLEEPKLTLGRILGGVIPLWRGADPRRWSELFADTYKKEPQADEVLVLAEGIENALSVVVADPSFRVAATVSLSNMAACAVELPACVKTIIIAADNDTNPKTIAAFNRAIEAHVAAGREVREARAPSPHKDFNDWLRALRIEQDTAGGRAQ